MPDRLRLLLLALCALLCSAAGDDEVDSFPLIAPDNPGGERLGDDDGADGFDGYPADPGQPGDAYYDASTEHRAYSPNWTGAYFGGGLLGGMASVRSPLSDEVLRAPAYGAFITWSSLNQILDLQGGYLGATFTLDGAPERRLRRHSIHGAGLAHPLFLAVLGGGRMATTIANWYILGGFAAERFAFDGTATAPDEAAWAFGWKVGTGIDTYLDSPHDGGAFWLGLQYQFGLWNSTRYVRSLPRARFQEHWLLVRLSYRWNGGFFRGGRGPDVP
jgi:hypothetical protein